MQVNIEVIEKPEVHTKATFELLNLNTDKDYKETLAIIFMISADYYLDPELEIEDLKQFKVMASEKNKAKLALFASEDGIEAEFLD
jgi:hypothetical protein